MSGVDASIPMGFRPTPNIGPDVAGALQNAQAMWQLDAAKKQQQSQNALKTILSSPGAIDASGNPTPDAMSKIMAADPATGMKFQQNALAMMQNQEQLRTTQLKRQQELSDRAEPIRIETYRVYNETPGSAAAKQAAAQKVYAERIEELKTGGGLSSEEAALMPGSFDLNRVIANSPTIQADLAKQKQQDLEQQHIAIERENAEQGRFRDTPVMMQDPNDPTKQILGFARTNTRTNAPPVFMPLAPGTTLATKPSASGSAELGDIKADVRAEHPDWTPGQVDLEADKRKKAATSAPAKTPGLDGVALDRAAEVYHKSGDLPGGYGGQADREAIMKREAELYPPTADNKGGFDLAARAQLKADRSDLVKLTQQQSAINSYENTAIANGDVLVALANKTDKTHIPVIERWIRAGRKAIAGDTDVTNLDAQMKLFGAEVGRIVTNPSLTGVLSDSARKEGQAFAPEGASAKQIESLVGLLKGDFGRRKKSLEDEISTVRKRISDEPGANTSPDTKDTTEKGAAKTNQAGGGPMPIPAALNGMKLDQNRELRQFRDRATGKLYNADGTPVAAKPDPAKPAAPAGQAQTTAQPTDMAKPAAHPALREGATATNAKTGARMVVKDGRWVPIAPTVPFRD